MNVPIEAACQEFLETLEAEGRSPQTIKQYRHVLKPLIAKIYGSDVDRVNHMAIREYVTDLRMRLVRYEGAPQRPEIRGGLSSESIRAHVRVIKIFFNWCQRQYDIAPIKNPVRNLRMPPMEQQVPKAIDLDDLQKLLLTASDGTITGRRDLAILAFLIDTGCRAGGLISLRKEDLHMERRQAVLREKGNRIRAVPFSREAATLLRHWLAVCPDKSKTVFCSLGTNHHAKQLTVSGLNQILKRLAKKAGVKGRCNPHSFRHGFAKFYLTSKGDTFTLAQLMGHGDVRITARYAMLTDLELADQHDQHSPLKGLLGGKEWKDRG